MSFIPKILIIAGSDSGGGAGIQADIKTITYFKAYAMTAVTAITAQNTMGVQSIYPLPKEIVIDQIQSVLNDLSPDVIKIFCPLILKVPSFCSTAFVFNIPKSVPQTGSVKHIVPLHFP